MFLISIWRFLHAGCLHTHVTCKEVFRIPHPFDLLQPGVVVSPEFLLPLFQVVITFIVIGTFTDGVHLSSEWLKHLQDKVPVPGRTISWRTDEKQYGCPKI